MTTSPISMNSNLPGGEQEQLKSVGHLPGGQRVVVKEKYDEYLKLCDDTMRAIHALEIDLNKEIPRLYEGLQRSDKAAFQTQVNKRIQGIEEAILKHQTALRQAADSLVQQDGFDALGADLQHDIKNTIDRIDNRVITMQYRRQLADLRIPIRQEQIPLYKEFCTVAHKRITALRAQISLIDKRTNASLITDLRKQIAAIKEESRKISGSIREQSWFSTLSQEDKDCIVQNHRSFMSIQRRILDFMSEIGQSLMDFAVSARLPRKELLYIRKEIQEGLLKPSRQVLSRLEIRLKSWQDKIQDKASLMKKQLSDFIGKLNKEKKHVDEQETEFFSIPKDPSIILQDGHSAKVVEPSQKDASSDKSEGLDDEDDSFSGEFGAHGSEEISEDELDGFH